MDSMPEGTTYFHHQTWKSRAGVNNIQKLHSYELAFIVLEGTVHTIGGERNHPSYPGTNPVTYNSNLPKRYIN